MTQLFHLVRADLRRFWVLLATWVLVVAADTVLRGVRPALATDPRLVSAFDLLAAVLFLARWLGWLVIVPLVVQTHALVGSDAFWMTRPIPWRALFGSKVVLLWTTCVAVAVVCEAALMLALRMPVSAIAPVTLQTVLLQSLFLFILMALSTTTRNLAGFALVSGGLLVAFVLVIYAVIAVMMRNMPEGPQVTAVTGRAVAGPTAAVVFVLLLIIAAIVQLVLQYRTRSTRLSVGAGVAGIAAAFLIAALWPSHERPLPLPEWAGRESSLRLIAESRRGEFRPVDDGASFGGWQRWHMGNIRLSVSGVEPGWLATARLRDATVEFDDGSTLATAGNGYSTPLPVASVDEYSPLFVMRQALGASRLFGGSPSPPADATMPAIVLTQADFRTHSGSTATYRGHFLVDLDHVEIAATLPLQPGAEFRDRWRRVVVDRVALQGRAASIRLRQFTASSMFDASAFSPVLSFYLRNRATSEAVAGSTYAPMSIGLGTPYLFGVHSVHVTGFSATREFIRFPDYYGATEQGFEISSEWLSQAELAVVRTAPAGAVTITLEVPGFTIDAAPPRLPR
jgi:hypothetical protein